MALKIRLKSEEKIIIGGAVIRNGMRHHADFFVENNVPILRQKDIITEIDAITPARRLYYLLQLLYIDAEQQSKHLENLLPMIQDIAEAAPSTEKYLGPIREQLSGQEYYQALKTARQLIEYEQILLGQRI